jgi:2-polyprenyl-3-methyl-5-hydroxy-6-metoxy-1,4-benzoquinol methylase
MKNEKMFQERYKSGDTPWDFGRPDFNLVNAVINNPIRGVRALDVGCGTGDNAIWLANNGFQVTGIDVSDIALDKARAKATKANVECDFVLADFLKDKIKGAPFGFVFDRGCFHTFDSKSDKRLFARHVADHLQIGGFWLTLTGNADEYGRQQGPPQLTAAEIVQTVEPLFEVLSLASSHFASKDLKPPRSWTCLMRKRQTAR